jgi:hypothetical protein
MGRPAWRFLKYGVIYSPLFGGPIDKAPSGGHLVILYGGREPASAKKTRQRKKPRAVINEQRLNIGSVKRLR